jgi:hypothetical protein
MMIHDVKFHELSRNLNDAGECGVWVARASTSDGKDICTSQLIAAALSWRRKEKLEESLKAQIKKLQRDRNQLSTWMLDVLIVTWGEFERMQAR